MSSPAPRLRGLAGVGEVSARYPAVVLVAWVVGLLALAGANHAAGGL